MTIELGTFGFNVQCDFCSFDQDFDTDHWPTLIAQAKDHGWKFFKDEDGEWTHKCSSCQENGK